jgi:hypothetical protein
MSNKDDFQTAQARIAHDAAARGDLQTTAAAISNGVLGGAGDYRQNSDAMLKALENTRP